VLGVASLLTDLSSEMIMPLLPAFLAGSLGAGAVALGVIEGVADSTASFLKLWAGVLTDRFQRRKPFIVAGYSISGLIRPLVGLALSWPFVAGIRFLDRVGKGVRTSPRDALIADVPSCAGAPTACTAAWTTWARSWGRWWPCSCSARSRWSSAPSSS
jgi:hypothetical protein